jgi:hypothetical protein
MPTRDEEHQQGQYTEIRIRNLTDDLCDTAKQFLSGYSVALVLEDALAGSGTFIKCGRIYGILTAHHVVHNPLDRNRRFDFSWGSSQELGLPLIGGTHRFTLPMRLLRCVDVGIPRGDPQGPDLAVIILPETEIGDIKARRSFFDISIDRDSRLLNALDDRGIWVAAGVPQRFVESYAPTHGFDVVNQYWCTILLTGIRQRQDDGAFDYVHLAADTVAENEHIDSYGGMSGGGVWKLCLARDRRSLGSGWDLSESILAGTIFYETFRNNRPHELRCHGGKSIYQNVYEALSKWESQD